MLGILLAGGPVLLEVLGIADIGPIVQIVGGIVALVGLAMAAVALWLRRSVKSQTQLRDVEIDRRLRGRSEMEAELVDAELKSKAQLTSLGLPDLAAAEDLLDPRGGARRADRPARRPAGWARRQGKAIEPCDRP